MGSKHCAGYAWTSRDKNTMRTVLFILLTGLVVPQSVNAERLSLSLEKLQEEANLIVVGQVEKLRIETER